MTSQRQLQPAAQTGAVNRGDHRGFESFQAVEKALAGFGEFGRFGGGAAGLQHVDVGAGHERAGFAADQHHSPHIGVLFQAIQQGGGLGDEFGFQGVLAFAGHVDGGDGDAVRAHRQLENGQIGLGRHHATSRTRAAPKPPAAQAVASPSPPPRRRNSFNTCTIIRPPVAAKGCP